MFIVIPTKQRTEGSIKGAWDTEISVVVVTAVVVPV